MRFEKKAMSELNPALYNPRKRLRPGDSEYQKLKRSIEEFGMVDPIVWNERTGNIVGGHQRYTVLHDMGVEETEVSVVDMDEVQEKALNVALNKVDGEWEKAKLETVLEELSKEDFDLTLTGFDADEIEKMLELDLEVDDGELPEMEFSEELKEEHNFVLLYFDNEVDWLQAQTLLDIKSVLESDTSLGRKHIGVGRVLRGADVLQKLVAIADEGDS